MTELSNASMNVLARFGGKYFGEDAVNSVFKRNIIPLDLNNDRASFLVKPLLFKKLSKLNRVVFRLDTTGSVELLMRNERVRLIFICKEDCRKDLNS